MIIKRSYNENKLTKRRQYVGNIYVRPRRLVISTSSPLDNGENVSEGGYFKASSGSFEIQSSTEGSSAKLAIDVEDIFYCNYAKNQPSACEDQLSCEQGPYRHERQQDSIVMIMYGKDSPKKQLEKKISLEAKRRNMIIRKKSCDESSELTSCLSLDDYSKDDDTSTF